MKVEDRTIELEVLKLADGGDGFGRLDGKACFVPLAAPGDRVRARVTRETGSYLRAAIEEIVEAGPGRVEPACEAYGVCGGCNLMHLSIDVQLEAKAKTLLRILGGEVEIVHSPRSLGYRGRALMRFRPGAAGGRLGFFGRKGRELIDVKVCPVLAPSLEAVLPYLREGLLENVGRPVDVRLVAGRDGPLVSVEADGLLPRGFYEGAALVVPGVLAGVQAVTDGVTASVAGEALATLEGSDGEDLLAPISGFGQANAGVNRLLGRTLRDWIDDGGYASAIELFAGAGNLTVGFAGSLRKIVAVEVNPSACEVMRVNLLERGMHHAKVVLGDALVGYRESGEGAELVVLDPPRSGARELCRAIARGGHRGVIYVSCDPATLGRDLDELEAGGFKPVEAKGFDMFPQTAHVETAVWLERV